MAELQLNPEVTINYAAEFKEDWLARFDKESEVVLDASKVVEFDGAGLQLLIALKKWCDNSDKTMKIVNPSEIVEEVFQLVGAAEFFDDSASTSDKEGE